MTCGRLHCAHLNERLEYGVESSAKLSVSFMKLDGKVLPCRSAIVDLGLRERDPGLVPQGATCGSGKVRGDPAKAERWEWRGVLISLSVASQ